MTIDKLFNKIRKRTKLWRMGSPYGQFDQIKIEIMRDYFEPFISELENEIDLTINEILSDPINWQAVYPHGYNTNGGLIRQNKKRLRK